MAESKRKAPVMRRQKGKKRVQERSQQVKTEVKYSLSFTDALQIFVDAKKAEGMRPRTINDYYMHIKWFTNFLKEF